MDDWDKHLYEEERKRRIQEYEDRMRGFEVMWEEPVRKRKKVKKITYTEILKIYTNGKGSCQEFNSEENAWTLKTDGITIYTPTKLKAIKTMFIPIHNVTFTTVEKQPVIKKNDKLEKLLESTLK